MPGDVETTAMRSAIALLVGFALSCSLVFLYFAFHYRAALGVFSAEDWLRLAPDFWGKVLDYIYGLSFFCVTWAVLHFRHARAVIFATAVGALSIYLAPKLVAWIYLWIAQPGLFEYQTAGSLLTTFLGSPENAATRLAMGALLGTVMWRVAYRHRN